MGRGVEVDLAKAWAWYNVAANPRDRAVRARDKPEQKMSSAEFSRVQLATLVVPSCIKFNGSRI
jgi:TPR repeat protein